MKIDSKYLGLVTKKFNEFFLVDFQSNGISPLKNKFLCRVKKSINFRNQIIYVGDEVIIDQVDSKRKRARIESVIKRKNLLKRPSVANISNIYVVFSVEEPKLNLSQVSKFLVSSELLDVEVSLVLTKCDLISEKKRLSFVQKFKKWGYRVITLNKNQSINFTKFLTELKTKKCSILIGPSGVGKTTLLNIIIPGLKSKTAPVSNKIKRGKNTTRNIELFPLSINSYIVDTPGFNMQSNEIDLRILPNLFPEISSQVIGQQIKCKFRDCLHLEDDGCNLNKSFERYNFYKEMNQKIKSHYLVQED